MHQCSFRYSGAGKLLNELHQLLFSTLRWSDLTDSVLVQGVAPSAREMPGVASDGSLVFIFGGGGIGGVCFGSGDTKEYLVAWVLVPRVECHCDCRVS
jgi:hypothetical protein